MTGGISHKLQQRLEGIARRRHCSLEELLHDYADQAEQDDFPANPYRFLELTVALICVTDLEGNFLYVNPAFERVLGYKKENMIGKTYKVFIHPDDLEATQDAQDQLTQQAIVTHFENRYRHQDGSYRWLSWTSALNSHHIYSVALDVTDQIQSRQQQQTLLEQNQRILKTMFDGYLLGDTQGNILDVNSAYCQMVGYDRDTLLKMKIYDLDVAVPDTQMDHRAQQITDNDISMIVETQHQHKNGEIINVEINSIQLEKGQIACFIRDISERKQLEKELRQSEQFYRGLIESQIDFICRYTPETILTFVNDAYCRFFERSPDQLIGTSFLELTPDLEKKSVFMRIEAVMQNPAPDARIFHTYNANGKIQWIQWVDYGITDETGAVVEIQAIGRDVTQLIETQERLAQREEMMSTIFSNIPVMLAQFDEQGRFEYVNQHWIDVLGWTAEEMRDYGDIMSEFYPDPNYRQKALDFMTSGVSGWQDFKTRTRDGNIVDTSWANVQLSNGRKLGIGQVITHRVELENQRIYANKLEAQLEKERQLREAKDRFVSLISHEFRTPLAVMTTSIGLIVHYFDRLSTDRILNKLLSIQQQITRMVELMEDALRFSKSQARKTEFSPTEIEILPFLQSIIQMMELTDNGQHQISLVGDAGSIKADPKLCEHIISNLLSNALKYSPEATTITVKTSKRPSSWQISVQDHGIGIPEEDLSDLFEPFHRARNAYNLPGTGLGLSIVKDYIDIHGGDIYVNSKVGHGTTFTVILPK